MKYFVQLLYAIDMKLYTKVPTKYVLIDEETLQVYRGNDSGTWDKVGYLDEYLYSLPYIKRDNE